MNLRKLHCLVLAAALLPAAAPARAQMYSWREPATGQSKLSNIPPAWYIRGEPARGPRVVATLGGRVIDDTALPYEERLRLAGKPQESNGRPQPPRAQAPTTQRPAQQEPEGARRGAEDVGRR